jgi:hypothetical protein
VVAVAAADGKVVVMVLAVLVDQALSMFLIQPVL